MAKALQCPDCGNRHPLDDVAHLRTFRCVECRRLLKVPPGLATANGESGSSGSNDGDVTEVVKAAGATKRVPPSQRGDVVRDQTAKLRADSMPAVAADRASLPRLVRIVVWLAAIPGGLVPVAILGRLFGVFTMDRAVDVFLGIGWERFIPPLVLLPVWAAASASVAHLALEGLARLRHDAADEREPVNA